MRGFSDAIEALNNGFFVRREVWPKNYYMVMENGRVISYIITGMTSRTLERSTRDERLFSLKDVEATDWIIYETKGELRVCEKYQMKPLTDFDRGCLMDIKEFMQDVKDGGFTDYDGFGKWATKDMVTVGYGDDVTSIIKIQQAIRDGFTHVCWYNK